MLNTLPKFELVPISRYFITLPKALRPSMMPSWRTRRPGSMRITSAESRATSAALDTEMPTSAACSEGASLMPSPMKPTAWPLCLRARRIRFFCAGRDAREDVRLLGVVSQRGVRHIHEIVTCHNVSGVQSYLRANAGGDKVVVAGDDLDLHSIVFERIKHLGGVRQGRIGKGQEAGQYQVALILEPSSPRARGHRRKPRPTSGSLGHSDRYSPGG